MLHLREDPEGKFFGVNGNPRFFKFFLKISFGVFYRKHNYISIMELAPNELKWYLRISHCFFQISHDVIETKNKREMLKRINTTTKLQY